MAITRGVICAIAAAIIVQIFIGSSNVPSLASAMKIALQVEGQIRVGPRYCVVPFSEKTKIKFENLTATCAGGSSTEAPADESKWTALANASLENFDFDDKCKTQCVYKEMNVLTGNDKNLVLKRDVINQLFDGNLTEIMKTKANSIWNKCIDQIGKIAKEKQFSDDSCRVVMLHHICGTRKMATDNVMPICGQGTFM